MLVPKDQMGLDGEETFKPLVPSFPSTPAVKRNDPTSACFEVFPTFSLKALLRPEWKDNTHRRTAVGG